ncbi:UNVERIFIED_CONTAM: hypothetical protein K2H54_019286 [Gekko kuhli]
MVFCSSHQPVPAEQWKTWAGQPEAGEEEDEDSDKALVSHPSSSVGATSEAGVVQRLRDPVSKILTWLQLQALGIDEEVCSGRKWCQWRSHEAAWEPEQGGHMRQQLGAVGAASKCSPRIGASKANYLGSWAWGGLQGCIAERPYGFFPVRTGFLPGGPHDY